jgi:hypothetical protein
VGRSGSHQRPLSRSFPSPGLTTLPPSSVVMSEYLKRSSNKCVATMRGRRPIVKRDLMKHDVHLDHSRDALHRCPAAARWRSLSDYSHRCWST